MHVWLIILLLLASCTPPAYENTTYDVEEFITDSDQIALGRQAILDLEQQDANICELVNYEYFEEVIIEGDELTVVLYCPRRPDRVLALDNINEITGFRVCNSNICLPHFSPIEVGGLTLRDARAKIQATYCEQLPDAQIFVNFKKRRERQVQIIGAGKPMITVDGRMRLSEVLAQARVPPTANLFKSYVMRNEEKLPIDLYKLMHEGDDRYNIVMRGGDQIFIANLSDATVMVTGEVRFPLTIPVPYGSLSLRQALVMAGGIPFTGNKGCIHVIRGDLVRPKIYSLAWKDITHLPNQSLLLMPGDIVVVSEKPITQWNRFISQVQPSVLGMQNAYAVYQIIKATTSSH